MFTRQPVVEVPYVHREGKRLVCDVCPVHCKLQEGQTGVCRGRRVEDGRMIAINYGRVVSRHLDPIEKKPLYHFRPGERIWSVGPNGCSFHCRWCQNCEISQFDMPTEYVAPQDLAALSRANGSIGLAFTYSEPLIWYETLRDTLPLVREQGGVNVLVTNGFIEEKPLEDLLGFVDAANVDLKFIDSETYWRYTGGDLRVVQRTIQRMVEAGVHVELTHLLVTDLADDEESVRRLTEWIANVDRKIPLHLTRYFPRHRWNSPPTDPDFLERAYTIARDNLDYVFVGNILASVGTDTECPSCGKTVIWRSGWSVDAGGVDGWGRCVHCGEDLRIRR